MVCGLTAPVGVGQVHDCLPVQRLVPGPDEDVSHQHEEACYQTTCHKHVAQQQVEGHKATLHPRPPAHGGRVYVAGTQQHVVSPTLVVVAGSCGAVTSRLAVL